MAEVQGLNSLGLPREPASPLVAISILNWNGWRHTLECIASVRQLDYPNYLIVVVDNGSSNESLAELRAQAKAYSREGEAFVEYRREVALAGGDPAREQDLQRCGSNRRLVLIDNAENLGFTGGNNVAIQYALRRPQPADYVLFLNNDAEMERDCLARLLEAGQASGVGIVGGLIKDKGCGQSQLMGCDDSVSLARQLFQPLFQIHLARPDHGTQVQAMSWVSGAAMLIRSAALEAVHRSRGCYLDSKLFLYGEDIEICEAARQAGYRTVMAWRAVIYHEAASSSGGQFNPLAYYYQNRNRIFLARGNLAMPWRVFFHLVNGAVCSARILKNLASRRPQAAGAIFRGMMDGYRGVGGRWKYHDRGTYKVQHTI
jgi:GT2 family glycosyltransferase